MTSHMEMHIHVFDKEPKFSAVTALPLFNGKKQKERDKGIYIGDKRRDRRASEKPLRSL